MMNKEFIASIFDYDPDTGLFRWKVKTGKKVVVGSVAGSMTDSGYLRVQVMGSSIKLHRAAFLLSNGFLPETIDHINGIRHDNRSCNLREATKKQNARNSSIKNNNTSGVKGVHWNKQKERWQARAWTDLGRKHIGFFSSIEEARSAREKYIRIHHGEFYCNGDRDD